MNRQSGESAGGPAAARHTALVASPKHIQKISVVMRQPASGRTTDVSKPVSILDRLLEATTTITMLARPTAEKYSSHPKTGLSPRPLRVFASLRETPNGVTTEGRSQTLDIYISVFINNLTN